MLPGCAALLMMLGTCVCAGAAQQPAPAAPHSSPQAQALLARTIQALGGTDFLNVKTLTTEGRAFSIADGVTAGFVTYQSAVEYPDKRRLAYGFGRGKAVTLINNGEQGWEIDRYGLIEQTEKQIRAWQLANRYSLDNLLRVRAHEPGVLILTGGQDFVDNLPALILDVIDARQVDVKLYLDTQTYLPIRITYRIQEPATHDWDDYADVYANYQNIHGVKTPMHLVRYINGQRVAETFRSSAQYNRSYASSFFEPGP